jgi:serine/threonine-protein kinase
VSEEPGEFERLIDAVAEGAAIDWDAELARDPAARASLEALRLVDDVGRSQRRARLTATFPPPAGVAAAAETGPMWGRLRVLEWIGGGTYGEVFRAFDPGLQIDVALKLWNGSLDRGSTEQLLAEARGLARIRHPNVLVVHGADEHDGRAGMWTDLLHGQTLEEILAQRGPFSAHEAAVIGVDLCRAVAAVHATGFVHRDVKASNVMREQGGRIVLMDFGTVAGVADDAAPGAAAVGTIVGTPISKPPEQLSGDRASAAFDLYGLGVLLYRLVTDRHPVEAGSLEELRERHARGEFVPLRDRRADLPGAFVAVVERALAREPARRFATAGELERALIECMRAEWVLDGPAVDGPAPPAPSRARRAFTRMAWAGFALAAVALGALLWSTRLAGPRAPSGPPLRYAIPLPAGQRLSGFANAALAPDGASIAYAAEDSTGSSWLWLRRLDASDAIRLPGTEGAFYPFWAPDSRDVAFFSRGRLLRVPVDGGAVRTICAARAGRGGTWGADGTILFAGSTEGPILRVRAAGGAPLPASGLDGTRGEIAHRWPCLLPDGDHFLYVSLPARDGAFELYAGSLRSGRRTLVGAVESGVAYAAGHLVYVANRTLLARPFDVRSLAWSGDPVPIADASRYQGSIAELHATASRSGALVYQSLTNRENRLAWVDADGGAPVTLAQGPFYDPAISPDGRRVAVERSESASRSNVWLLDAGTGATERWTDAEALNRHPVWSPAGDTLVFASNRGGRYGLFARSLRGSIEELSLPTPPAVLLKWPGAWSRDGAIAYTAFDPHSAFDVWLVRGGHAEAVARELANEINPAFSPDGAWLAWESDQSGRSEVYCRAPAHGPTVRLSPAGGQEPRWGRADGRLVYRRPDGAFIEVTPAPGVPPDRWSAREFAHVDGVISYDVAPRGRRLLCCVPALTGRPDELTVATGLLR